MRKRLLLNGITIPIENSVIALTLQCNDITKPDSIQAHYSNTFDVPDSLELSRILEHAGHINATTDLPYKLGDATLIMNGMEVVPFGIGKLKEYAPGRYASIEIFSGNINLFDALGEKTIRELNLSAFDHIWSSEKVIGSKDNHFEQGYVYDIIHRGIIGQETASKWTDLYPSTFVRTIWDACFAEVGFSYNWPSMPALFNKLLITPGEVYGNSSEFIEARSCKVSNRKGYEIFSNGAPLIRNRKAEKINFDDENSSNKWYDGVQNNYDNVAFKYVADSSMYATASFSIPLDLNVVLGKCKVKFTLLKNGVGVQNTERFFKFPFNQEYFYYHSFEPELLGAGESLELFIEIRDDSTVYNYECRAKINQEAYFQVDVSEQFAPGGLIQLSSWLPDMTCKDFIKAMMAIFDLTFQTDPYGNKLKISTFDSLLDNIPYAKDWSDKYHSQDGYKLSYTFGNFSQKNYIKWKSDQSVTKSAKVLLGKPASNPAGKLPYGDGAILITDQNLPKESTLYELPFSATIQKNGLPYVPMYAPIKGTTPIEYEEVQSTVRLLVRRNLTIEYSYLDTDGNPITYDDSTGVPVSTFIEELDLQNVIIPKYRKSLFAILDKTKFVSAHFFLSETDIAEMDFSYPVWVEKLKGYFYVNKIVQWISPQIPTEVELVRL
jgi:hypothetical protein